MKLPSLALTLIAATESVIIAPAQVQSEPGRPALAETAVLETPTARLYGTLLFPDARTPGPLVLILPGSGPTDRDGNAPQLNNNSNCYRYLAEALSCPSPNIQQQRSRYA